MLEVTYLTIILLLSLIVTNLVRRFATLRSIDIPNHRSSHTVPTPRGGGLGFVLVFLWSLPLLVSQFGLSLQLGFILAGAGFIVAAVGFFDDYFGLSARWRLLAHMLAAVLVLYNLGPLPNLTIGGHVWSSGIFMQILAFFYIVWFINLFNFMDGIDGLAAMEALTACIGAALMYYFAQAFTLMTLPLVLASALIGFLVWNFPKAKIFMGDAGSGFLGIIMGILSIISAYVNPAFFWGWLILLSAFIVDSTFTLGWRALTGKRFFEAHRTHAYQHASLLLQSHWKVTISFALVIVLWLFPLAILVGSGRLLPLIGMLLAYIPLIIVVFVLKAGR